MASSSSSHIKRYNVFSSFHGPDVRQGFLSHLHTHFATKGITTFNDEEIVRGQTIGPELVQAIRESRVSIVVLSKKYASSSWCLGELVEILKCKKDQGQTVIPIFYKVDPSDVKKQRGKFGSTFKETCEGKSEEVKQIWSKALADVATIAGQHSLHWANEAEMIQKIATDVLEKLNATPSRDFEDMVGLKAHLRNLDSLLCLESNDVKMIGIWGPAGIGKSTIAEAVYRQLKGSFQLSCSMGNLKGSYKSTMGATRYESELYLQNLLLSKILNQKDLRVIHLGTIKERLQDQRVLIVLDDVDDLELLKILVKDISWFGSGSRIIITTEDKKILTAHDINNIYHVDYPSNEEALEILCRAAFKQSSVPEGYEELAKKVAEFCGKLPLGLRVVGSSLHRESKHEWENQLSKIETTLDRDIDTVLRMGYNRLTTKDQSLFLHIACFFNNHVVDQVTSMLDDSGLDARNGLKTLAEKSLVHTNGSIVMHYLLQQLGSQIVREQSNEPGKRQFLVEVKEICDVLANGTGTGSVLGISLDASKINHNVSVDKRAFEGMHNLQFLRIYKDMSEEFMGFFLENPEIFSGEADDFLRIHKSWLSRQPTLQIPEDMEYLSRVRLLHWESYPRNSLPSRFKPNCLIELHMPRSNLKKLWGGIEPLPHLKSIDLSRSHFLEEIPNLSEATNLQTLNLEYCLSLVELPSSIGNLHNLKKLKMNGCKELRVIPTDINLLSLEEVEMSYCSQLRIFPVFSMNIKELRVLSTKIEEIPSSIRNLRKLKKLVMHNCQKLRVIPTNINLPSLEVFSVNTCSQLASFPDISSNITELDIGNTKIKDVPPSVVRCWSRLECLEIGSRSLKRLTHVPLSVRRLILSNSDIERIPDCVTGLPHLVFLDVEMCLNLVSIPALSPSLEHLRANDCLSLKKVCCSFPNQTMRLSFYNCIQLDEESRRGIIQESIQGDILLPGKEIPAEFTHKATGNSITIPLAPRGDGTFSASSRFKACILLSSVRKGQYEEISCCLRSKGDGTVHSFSRYVWLSDMPSVTEHLFIFRGDLIPQRNRCQEVDVTVSEITIEFSSKTSSVEIIECGVEIIMEEAEGSSSSQMDSETGSSSREQATTTTIQMETEMKTMKQKVSDDPIFQIVSDYSVFLQLSKHEFHDLRLTEEAEGSSSSQVDNFEIGSSSSKVDCYESGGNNHHHIDGDGDEDYEAEDFKFSQDENIKTSKYTRFRSWLRKLGLKRRG